ncbi:hypothetical protein KMP13_01970 [Epibacterium ulvae]|nr:hypothetical protein [Epibacterium ulvae]
MLWWVWYLYANEPIAPQITAFSHFIVYDWLKSPDTLLVIATGETRRFANLLLTVGAFIL